MPKQKDFRVIPGGKALDPAGAGPAPVGIRHLLDRARHYRHLLSERPGSDTESLISDFEDAIDALRRLQQSSEAGADTRANEYRRLVAELELEIMAALTA